MAPYEVYRTSSADGNPLYADVSPRTPAFAGGGGGGSGVGGVGGGVAVAYAGARRWREKVLLQLLLALMLGAGLVLTALGLAAPAAHVGHAAMHLRPGGEGGAPGEIRLLLAAAPAAGHAAAGAPHPSLGGGVQGAAQAWQGPV
ncbi:MAG: hypothetical protein J3K34DRAFT_164301 [Monoraphidium minutum]|nr:MAG: hypothetical protein J3K34DRAFT_164301 [Monoraphidium minutum]